MTHEHQQQQKNALNQLSKEEEKPKFESQSLIDPSRKTVGAIYRDAQIENKKDLEGATIGDLGKEFLKSFVDDLNEALQSNPFNGKPFYVQVYEKWDYQMEKSLRRMLNKFAFRPYPEAGTTVFWTDPNTHEVRFCWDLPHPAEMHNILANELLYPRELIIQLKAWKRIDLYHFGFHKNILGDWEANPKWKDKVLKQQ
jgi:hypothetical protein